MPRGSSCCSGPRWRASGAAPAAPVPGRVRPGRGPGPRIGPPAGGGGREKTPIDLTDEEIAAVTDGARLLAKTRATAKIRGHLEALRWALFPRIQAGHAAWDAPAGFDPDAAQIARGQNLEGTPYQYLDFPRHFAAGEFFTFRTLVWWGRSVSYCWILQGGALSNHRARLKAGLDDLVRAGIGVWFGGDPWDWGAHVALTAVPPDALDALGFLKVGREVPLGDGKALTRAGLVDTGTAVFGALEPVVTRPSGASR
jgi:hypothetical protein